MAESKKEIKTYISDASDDMTWHERLYVPALAKGFGVFAKHFFRNLLGDKEEGDTGTIQYPEQKIAYSERWRGAHRLTKRPDGSTKCVACMMCSTACPAQCIHIIAKEVDDPNVEKAPEVFVIDELRCIFCGMCVEACPKDAIRMDTGIHVPAMYSREEAVWDLDKLISNKGVRGNV
ncbi:MAG: NAD(P)H-quinone oxidoreductase subunit I, chloroplastic [Myxococcota bacterium]|nr:NAD(P)H-quinone oxidoreductase subunit I, chloroplastic [Myxococcota bacterium]